MPSSVRPLPPLSPVNSASPATHVATPASFPELPSEGRPVRAQDFIQPRTGLWMGVGFLALGCALLYSVVLTFGAALLFLPIGWILERMRSKQIMARLRGNNLQVSSRQLPALHECAQAYARRLGLAEVPRLFVMEASSLNAFAFRVGARKVVSLIDDVVWGAIAAEKPGAVQFIIAHELAHHALGHTGLIRFTLSNLVKPLSRLDELSADAVALQLVGDRDAAIDGIMLLTVGPQMMRYVDRDELLSEARAVAEDKLSKKAEKGLTHPLSLRRIAELQSAEVRFPADAKPRLAG